MQYGGRLIGTWPVCRVASREWKRTRRSALRHSRPQCKLLPSRACLKADGLLVARARGHKERASNLWMARAGRNQEKHPMCTRLLSSSCFSAPSTLTLAFSSCTRQYSGIFHSYINTHQLGTHTASVLTAKLHSSPALRILARVAAMAQ